MLSSFVSLFLFVFCVCHAVLYVNCGLVVSCWGRADLLTLLHVMLYFVFVTSPCVVLGQVEYMIV